MNIQVIEHKEVRVLTTQQLAEVYETSIDNIKMNFKRNKERFIEGRDYYFLKGNDLREFLQVTNSYLQISNKTRSLYLWTERGANRHSKILDTDKAWQQFDVLEETYFKVKSNQLQLDSYMIVDPIERAKRWIEEQKEKEHLRLSNKMKDQQIAELKPKADYCDIILQNKGLSTINAIAKDYGMSAHSMNKKLHELGVQYKQGNQWFLYYRYQDKGYTQSQTIDITRSDGTSDITMHTKWTQKGRLFLYELLKNNDILPTIERQRNR
jgi:phage antirepressor YoqD-like protein